MKEIPNHWIARKNNDGYIELVCFEDAISRKPTGWKVIGLVQYISYRQARLIAKAELE